MLITPKQQAQYRALAAHEGVPLSEIIRQHLDARLARLERRGVKLARKRRP